MCLDTGKTWKYVFEKHIISLIKMSRKFHVLQICLAPQIYAAPADTVFYGNFLKMLIKMNHVHNVKLLSKFYIIFHSLLFNDLYYFQHREWIAAKRQSLPLAENQAPQWTALPSCGCRHSRRRMYVPKSLSSFWVCYCGFLSLSFGSCFSRLYFDCLWTICLKSTSVIKNNTSD